MAQTVSPCRNVIHIRKPQGLEQRTKQMKIYNSKSGAQNQATRLNKVESANNTFKFWAVETILVANEIKYIIEADFFGGVEIYGA